MGTIVVTRFAKGLSAGSGSCDFYYYIVIARDWFELPAGESPSPMWFFYNPGIYRFYHALMLAGVTSAQGLLIGINSLNLVNAVMLVITLLRMKVFPIISVWAGIWYIFISEHFEGLGGFTEPLVVFPTVLCLAIIANPKQPWWQGRSLIILAAGLALSLYAKQQGVLYTFGGICTLFWVSNWRQLEWLRHAVILGSVVAAIFLLLLTIENGTLLDVLRPRINAVVTYQTAGTSLWSTLGDKHTTDPKLGMFLIQLAAMLAVLRFFNAGRRWLITPMGSLFTLGVTMALASAWQVHTRPYVHYLLLTWPPLILAIAISVHVAMRQLVTLHWQRTALWITLLILAVPFTRLTPHYGRMYQPHGVGVPVIDAQITSWGAISAQPWFFPRPTILLDAPIHSFEPLPRDVINALPNLRVGFPERIPVIVMPAHFTAIYWYLNLHHPLGNYGFPKPDSVYQHDLRSAQTKAVLLSLVDKYSDPQWADKARNAGFVQTAAVGPILLMRRELGIP